MQIDRRLVTGFEGDLRHQVVAEDEAAGGPVEADAAHVVAGCLTQVGGEDAVEVEG